MLLPFVSYAFLFGLQQNLWKGAPSTASGCAANAGPTSPILPLGKTVEASAVKSLHRWAKPNGGVCQCGCCATATAPEGVKMFPQLSLKSLFFRCFYCLTKKSGTINPARSTPYGSSGAFTGSVRSVTKSMRLIWSGRTSTFPNSSRAKNFK